MRNRTLYSGSGAIAVFSDVSGTRDDVGETSMALAQRRDVPSAPEIFLGAATVGGARPDVAGIYGAQVDRAGWSLNASGLAPGTYELTAYFWSNRTEQFEDARTVIVSVR